MPHHLADTCCVVIPAFREVRHIGDVVRATLPFCPHVLVIDDGSGDGTAEQAERAGARVIRHERNRGKGAALETGFDAARKQGFRVVITLDADGQHDPAEIPQFLEAHAQDTARVLTGNRMAHTESMPRIRIGTNRFMSWLLSREMGQHVPDTQCGYRLYPVEVLPWVKAACGGFAAESEQLLHLAQRGVRIGSVPVRTIYGTEKSKINPVTDTIRFFSMLHRYRSERKTARQP